MRINDIISKKKNGEKLNKEEIDFFISGYVNDTIPDYQISALLMAIWFNKLTAEETNHLTNAMINSGDIVDLSSLEGIKVDKHSTGGVGDKTTLSLLPILAAEGLIVSKMSGRGLGHTGGTLDKLESIENLNVSLTDNEMKNIINENGFVICGQTLNIVPADKKLYALRDVTATVDNMQLIASSVMSKKLASGADYILLDVKLGSGAFIKTLNDAIELSKNMVSIGESFNKKVRTVISNMDEPLGNAVGNSIEVIEAIETLKGKGPTDFTGLCLFLAANMYEMTGIAKNINEGIDKAKENIKSGKSLNLFRNFIKLQNGNQNVIDNYNLFGKSEYVIDIKSDYEGYINRIDAETIGKAALLSGAGREKKGDDVDHLAGIKIIKKCNERVEINETIAIIHINKENMIDEIVKMVKDAYKIEKKSMKKAKKLIYGIVDKNGFKEY